MRCKRGDLVVIVDVGFPVKRFLLGQFGTVIGPACDGHNDWLVQLKAPVPHPLNASRLIGSVTGFDSDFQPIRGDTPMWQETFRKELEDIRNDMEVT